LKETLGNFQENNVKAVDSRLEGTRVEFNQAIERKDSNMDLEVHPTMARHVQGEQRGTPLSAFAHHGGRFYSVPKHILFSKVRLQEAICFWLKG
jgi:hypothetical protein